MNSSVETRYPFLDDDVINFCAGIAPEYKLRGLTEKWILRQVAAKTLPAADRQPAQDDVPRQPVEDLPRTGPPAWVDQLLSPESLRATGYFDPEAVARERLEQLAHSPDHRPSVRLRRGPDLRRLDPALAPPLLRRRPLRPAHLAAAGPRRGPDPGSGGMKSMRIHRRARGDRGEGKEGKGRRIINLKFQI